MVRPDRHGAVVAALRAELQAGRWRRGECLPPERVLAQRYAVSRLTLRKALAVLARERMVDRRHGSGTRAADVPAAEPVQPCVLYVGELDSHVYRDIFLGVAHAVARRGLALATWPLAPGVWQPPCERTLGSPAPLVLCQAQGYAACAARFAALGATPVLFGLLPGAPGAIPLRAVWSDRRHAAELAAQHLFARGRRRLLLVTHRPPQGEDVAGSVRQGFADAVRAVGLVPREVSVDATDPQREVQLAASLSDLRQRPDAIACDMDWTATAVYGALARLGWKIPREVAVTGLGDTPWAESMRPPLTSVDFAAREMAELAVAAALLPPPERAIDIAVAPQLRVRASS